MTKKNTFIDLFAGCGGFSEGFYNEDFKSLSHVDFDQPCCDTLSHRLRSKGYSDDKIYRNVICGDITKKETQDRLIKAVNGQEGLSKAQAGGFDLVISDVNMPVMDGIEATRIIRQELRSKTVIFGCTADVFKEAHDNFVNAGANHILTKPLQKESFIDALQRYQHLLVKFQKLLEKLVWVFSAFVKNTS